MTKYDDSIAAVAQAIHDAGLGSRLPDARLTILRDASGLLTVVDRAGLDEQLRNALLKTLEEVKGYVDADTPIVTPREIFDDKLSDERAYQLKNVTLRSGEVEVFYLDRRIVGGDWLSPVRERIDAREIPIIVFASLKGGVGRSTALAVTARHLSSQNLRVLCVDLDLEAPGIGSMLLPPGGRSEYGTLDFYAEHHETAFKADEFINLMEASNLSGGGAPIYVAPAFGSASLANPENIIGKLSRAYVEDVDSSGNILTFLDRTRLLIEGLSRARDFDVILIDSRAGLHETVAAPILGLNADVLLFGVDQPQTFEGYRALFAQLQPALSADRNFALRLRMVNSKADLINESSIQNFTDKAHDIFVEYVYDSPATSVEELENDDSLWYNIDDSTGPHFPWLIPDANAYRLFDPQRVEKIFEAEVYSGVFGDFLDKLSGLIKMKSDK